MSNENLERLWEVCDDLGYDIDTEQVEYMWRNYCSSKGIEDADSLPLSPTKLFSMVEEAYELLEEELITG